jgi:cyclophilin family peptidyl-prolyl cis-trans isomerase
VALIEALTAMKNRAGLATAELHLNTGLTENVSAAAIVYVAAILGDRAIGRIDSLLYGAPSPAIRAACAEAYRAVNSDKVIPRLATLFADEDPLVRAGAFDVLMAVDSANLDFYLRKALADPDFMPNVLAINQIGERKLVSYLPNLVAFMARGVEADVDIRRSVIDAAGSLCDTLGPDSSLIKLLVDAMSDPEYVVCRQAAEIYRDKIGVDRTTVIRPARTHFTARQIESALAKYPTNPKATIITEKGAIELTLRFDTAPLTVMNFIELFHRVVPNFVVQGGDPLGTGWGGPDWFIRCEYSDLPYDRGAVGVATSGKDTGGSQFFITLSPQPRLEARYTVFGYVTAGMDLVDDIVKGDVIQKIVIQKG